MTVPHPQSWRAPPKQKTPPGALPHFRGPFTCEMSPAMPLREGAPVPPLMYAALLSQTPDADGYNFVEVEGGWPRHPLKIVGRSATHLAIDHPVLFEVPSQDVASLALFDHPDPGSGALLFYGALRSNKVQSEPERRFEFPTFGILLKRPPGAISIP